MINELLPSTFEPSSSVTQFSRDRIGYSTTAEANCGLGEERAQFSRHDALGS
jgi:hypothetical protein